MTCRPWRSEVYIFIAYINLPIISEVSFLKINVDKKRVFTGKIITADVNTMFSSIVLLTIKHFKIYQILNKLFDMHQLILKEGNEILISVLQADFSLSKVVVKNKDIPFVGISRY